MKRPTPMPEEPKIIVAKERNMPDEDFYLKGIIEQ